MLFDNYSAQIIDGCVLCMVASACDGDELSLCNNVFSFVYGCSSLSNGISLVGEGNNNGACCNNRKNTQNCQQMNCQVWGLLQYVER